MGYLDILVYRCKLTILKFYQKFQFIFFFTVFRHKIHVKNMWKDKKCWNPRTEHLNYRSIGDSYVYNNWTDLLNLKFSQNKHDKWYN